MDHPASRKAMATVVVDVVDVNNHWPVMSQTLYSGSVQENSAKGTLVYQVQASDGDRVSIELFQCWVPGTTAKKITWLRSLVYICLTTTVTTF